MNKVLIVEDEALIAEHLHLILSKDLGIDADIAYKAKAARKMLQEKTYDLILVVHTFEHLLELDQFVQKILSLLAEDGCVYVEVPGLIGLNKKWEDTATEGKFTSSNNIMSYLQFQHNYHFDLTHLMEFWQRNGFEMTQGDEWIRALFKKGQVTGNIGFDNNILS